MTETTLFQKIRDTILWNIGELERGIEQATEQAELYRQQLAAERRSLAEIERELNEGGCVSID